ncbi:MAG: hypothetical protein ACLRTQ_11635 [Candidatus Borkfalkia sp.]
MRGGCRVGRDRYVSAGGEDITVRLPGGELVVNVGDRVLMTGEARMVFTGETEL